GLVMSSGPLGVAAAQGLAPKAVVAPMAAAAVGDMECTYSSWTLPFTPTITAVAADGRVSLELSDFPEIAGPPPFVTVSNVAATATATYGGESISLTGSQAIAPPTPMADGFPVPTLSAERPGDT